jgi:hypothetical protein
MADAEEPHIESDHKDMSETGVSTGAVVAETEADEGNVFDDGLVAPVADTKVVHAASASLATGVRSAEEHHQLSHMLNSEAHATMPDRTANYPDAGSESDADDDGIPNDFEQEHEKLWSSDDDEDEDHDPDSAVAYTTEAATTAGNGAPPLVASHASTLRETQTRLRRQEVRHHIEQPVTASLCAHHFSVANTCSLSSVGVWLLHQHAQCASCGRAAMRAAVATCASAREIAQH